MGEVLTKELRRAGNKTQYNNYARSLLHNRYILAWILRDTTEEFKHYSISEIAEQCIEGKGKEHGEKLIDEKLTDEKLIDAKLINEKLIGEKIIGEDTQNILLGMKNYTQDVRISAIDIKKKSKKLLFNLEAQKKYNPGYILVTRGIFYGSLMLAEQAGTEFTGDNYDALKKVYSIWICMNVPKKIGNTICKYEIRKEDICGHVPDNRESYDKLTVIQIGLNREVPDKPGTAVRLLNILFSQTLTAEERIRKLKEEFDIIISEKEKEELDTMCDLAEGIYEDGLRKGKKEGRYEAAQQLISNIENAARNLSVTVEKACQILGVTIKQYQRAKRIVK